MATITLVDRNKLRISNLINTYESERHFSGLKKYLESKNRPLLDYDKRKRKQGQYKVYLIEGTLNEENVKFINNNDPKNSIYLLKNTKGQSSDILCQIDNNVLFSVYGGFVDVEYMYANRTMHRPSTLTRIIKIFELIESKINHNWNDIEKCMFYYAFLVRNLGHMNGDESWSIRYDNEHIEVATSLACMIGKKGVCAGKALVFKEAMDRIGIPCMYQNTEGSHDFNIVKLGGKWCGVDITWDSGFGKTRLDNFASKSHVEYISQYGHGGYSAPYHLEKLFSTEELKKLVDNYSTTTEQRHR